MQISQASTLLRCFYYIEEVITHSFLSQRLGCCEVSRNQSSDFFVGIQKVKISTYCFMRRIE